MGNTSRTVLTEFWAGCLYLVVYDPASGRDNRHTVYQINLWGDKDATIIGRELTYKYAMTVVRQAKRKQEK